jgi:hypothetical protein
LTYDTRKGGAYNSDNQQAHHALRNGDLPKSMATDIVPSSAGSDKFEDLEGK